MSRPITDLVGHTYSRLTVLSFSHRVGRKTHWECRCDCGRIATVEGGAMRCGHTASCGCIRKERSFRTHGLHNSRQYHIWENMKARCSNPKCMYYKFYGGRGISVCERWLSFEGFWGDMKDGYSDSLTLDRIDPNGNYEPGNCRWYPPDEQHRNTRTNIWLTFRGRKQTRAQWSRDLKIRPGVILKRIRAGWSVDEALSTPPLKNGQKRKRPVS